MPMQGDFMAVNYSFPKAYIAFPKLLIMCIAVFPPKSRSKEGGRL